MRLIVSICFALWFGSSVVADSQQPIMDLDKLPFWPNFPAKLQVKPTQIVFVPEVDSVQLPIQIWGEGAGFIFVAKSPTQVIFGSAPRMEQAWEVTCRKTDCSLTARVSKVSANADETVAALRAALLFRDHQQNPAAQSDKDVTEGLKQTLPPVDIFLSANKRKRATLTNQSSAEDKGILLDSQGLLQGFRP